MAGRAGRAAALATLAGAALGAALGAVALASIARRGARRAAHLRRDVAVRLPLGPDGIVQGAEPIALAGRADRAALIVHGFGDAPDSVRALAEHLHAAGWTVHAPLLPGHGRTLDAFAATTADDWRATMRAALAELRARVPFVALVGVSMGGALSVALVAEAARDARPDALVLLAPYLAVPGDVRLAAAAHRAVALVAPWIESRNPRSIRDPAARAASRGYGVVAPRILRHLVATVDRARAALPRVTVPTFVILSRLDNRVAPSTATAAIARLGATDKEIVWLDRSGHVITVDHERERVFALVTDWLARRV